MRRPSVGDRRGRWTLLHELDTSRMSCVFLARDAAGHLAALKVPLEPELFERFANEVRLSERVQSAFTARVLDSRVEGPEPFVAFEYVQGPTLEDQLRLNGPKPDLRLLAVGLAEGLHRIHATGIVHRDLKPSNVIITSARPVIIDFGIARDPRSRPMTQAGVAIGTPGWLSPEQHRGDQVGPPSDIYGWGRLLAWGREKGLSEASTQGPSGISEELQEAIAQALSDDPAARPTAPELLARLAHEGQTVADEVARSWTVAPVVVPSAANAVGVSAEDAASPGVSPPSPVSSPSAAPPPPPPSGPGGGAASAGHANPAASQAEPSRGRRRRRVSRLVASAVVLLVVGAGLGLAAAGTAGDWFSDGPDQPEPDRRGTDQPASDGSEGDGAEDDGASEDAGDDSDDLGDPDPDPGMSTDTAEDDLTDQDDGGAQDDGGVSSDTSQLPDYQPDIAPPVPAHVQLTESGRGCEGGLCGCPATGSYSRIDFEHGEVHPSNQWMRTVSVRWSGNAPIEGQLINLGTALISGESARYWTTIGLRQEAFLDVSRQYWVAADGSVDEHLFYVSDRVTLDGRSYYHNTADSHQMYPRPGGGPAASHVLCYLQPATDDWEMEIPVTQIAPTACRYPEDRVRRECYHDTFEWRSGRAEASDIDFGRWMSECHYNCTRE